MPSLVERLLPPVAAFAAGSFTLSDDLDRLDRVRRVGAPEAAVLYCARTGEFLTGDALRRVGLRAGWRLVVNLDLLGRYGLLPPTTLAWGHGLRRLGNAVRHLDRRIDEADAEVACLFAERCLEWFFCRFAEGPRLPALTVDGSAPGLARDEGLRGLLQRLETPDCDPAAEMRRPGWDATSAVAARLAEMLIGREQLDEAGACLQTALARHGDDMRLRQLEGLWLSRSGRLAEAAARLEGLFDHSANDEETCGILGGVHKRRWRQDRADRAALEASHACYLRGWENSGHENLYLGTNAATTALWLGRLDEVRRLAEQVRNKVRSRESRLRSTAAGRRLADNYWDRVTLAEAALLRCDPHEARQLYREAFALEPAEAGSHRSTRQQLAELLPSFGMPADVDAFLRAGGS